MRFLVDAQLPPALARWLVAHGHVAEHANDIGPGDAPDDRLWGYALEHQAAIITKDEDFSARQSAAQLAPVVVWVRVGNTRTAALLDWFEPLLDVVVQLVDAGDRLIELN